MSSFSRLIRAFSTSSTPASQASSISRTVKSLSSDLYKERSLKRLVQKFKKFSEFHRFRCNTGLYKGTVRRLASAKRFRWIEEILEDQKKYKDMGKEGFAVRLISLYGESGMFDQASKVFDEMPDRKCDRTVKSFNALLEAGVNSKKFDKVDEIFWELPSKLSISPDVFSYNIVIKGFCEKGSFDSALSKLEEMEKKGVNPDLITFNTLLNGLYGKGRFSDGEKIWLRMESKKIVPNIRSYNARLVGLVSEKRMSEAVGLIEEMGEKKIKPDAFSFNALIKGFCCNDGNLEEAKKWYKQMGASDCDPDKVTFTTLISCASERGDYELAFELCKEIFELRCLVDAALLQNVVNELVKKSKIEEAKKLVELDKSNNYARFKLKLPSS